MFQLTLPAGLEEYVSLETDQLIFEESAKSLAQFKIVACHFQFLGVVKVKDNFPQTLASNT